MAIAVPRRGTVADLNTQRIRRMFVLGGLTNEYGPGPITAGKARSPTSRIFERHRLSLVPRCVRPNLGVVECGFRADRARC